MHEWFHFVPGFVKHTCLPTLPDSEEPLHFFETSGAPVRHTRVHMYQCWHVHTTNACTHVPYTGRRLIYGPQATVCTHFPSHHVRTVAFTAHSHLGAIGWCLAWTVAPPIKGAEVAVRDRVLTVVCSGLGLLIFYF